MILNRKYSLKNTSKYCLLLSFCFLSAIGYSQKKQRVYMSMKYKQVVDQFKIIDISVREKVDGKFKPILGIPVEISMDLEDGDSLLATIESNTEGIASLLISKDFQFMKDEDGEYTLRANFKGNDVYKKASKKNKNKELVVEANFETIDDEHIIKISASEKSTGEDIVPDELKFDIYVDRIFADLKVANGKLINGKAEIKFPNDIPGKEGELKIIVRIDEKKYGLIELIEKQNWGEPSNHKVVQKRDVATISYVAFMIVSVIVLAIAGILLNKRIVNKL